jgi:hypothetical protein
MKMFFFRESSMKFYLGTVMLAAFFVVAGCSRKPAYSNVNANKTRPEAETAQAGEGEQPPAADAAAANPPAQTPAGEIPPAQVAAKQPAEVKPPWFVDTEKGAAKDIPNYPKAARQSIMFGPLGGVETLSLVLESSSAMGAIADFYDKAVKDNKWTVVDRIRDPEVCEWILKKGEAGEAKIQIKKNPNGNTHFIVIARTEKTAQPAAAQK